MYDRDVEIEGGETTGAKALLTSSMQAVYTKSHNKVVGQVGQWLHTNHNAF